MRDPVPLPLRNIGEVERGDFRLGPIDLRLELRDRVAITGPNGAGKSTLIALLLGRLAPTRGTANLGAGVVIGEVDQARATFPAEAPTSKPSSNSNWRWTASTAPCCWSRTIDACWIPCA